MPNRTNTRLLRLTALVVPVGLAVLPCLATACPFCGPAESATSRMAMIEAAVIAQATGEATNPETRLRPYRVKHILKGEKRLATANGQPALLKAFSPEQEPQAEDRYFILGADDADELYWSAPLPLTPGAADYLLNVLPQAPAEGVERLRFFLPRLRSAEPFVADDAYAEFALTEYDVVKQLAPHLSRGELRKWIEDPQTTTPRRRLYLTLLGLCGKPEDASWLAPLLPVEQQKETTDRSLDALVACYITLLGEKALEDIEQRFLANPEAVFSDVNAVVLALRFHGEQESVVPRERVARSMRLVLRNGDWADIVVTDLTRWKDWSALDRLVEIYKNADMAHRYVRVPIVQYVKACPAPEAKAALQVLKEIDPQAVQRADSVFLPLGIGGSR